MKERPLHTHSMLPREFHQENQDPENFVGTPFDEDLLIQPRTNIREIEHTYFLAVALPGFNHEDIQVNMNNHKLYIRAISRHSIKDEFQLLRKEFDPGIQKRVFFLPPDADPLRMITRYKNGILKITLFKISYPSLN